MANTFGSPIIIDTASVPGLGIRAKVSKVIWHNPTTAGHQAIIAASDGSTVLLPFTAESDGGTQVHTFPKPQVWKNFSVPTLDSGVLYIYTVDGVRS